MGAAHIRQAFVGPRSSNCRCLVKQDWQVAMHSVKRDVSHPRSDAVSFARMQEGFVWRVESVDPQDRGDTPIPKPVAAGRHRGIRSCEWSWLLVEVVVPIRPETLKQPAENAALDSSLRIWMMCKFTQAKGVRTNTRPLVQSAVNCKSRQHSPDTLPL